MVRSLTITLNSLAALVVVITSCISSNALLISPLPVRKSPFGVSNGVCRRESDSVVRRDLSFARPNTVMMATSGPAVLDRPTVEKKQEKAPVKDKRSMGNESWEVRIYNDGTNTREHVARCLVRVTGLTEIAAYGTMIKFVVFEGRFDFPGTYVVLFYFLNGQSLGKTDEQYADDVEILDCVGILFTPDLPEFLF